MDRRGSGRARGGDYQQNVGVPGVVYILANEGLRAGWYKIGCSRRSGEARAMDLNIDANTGTPGAYRCVFEVESRDCGTAEQLVFAQLAAYRRGKWGQEFFEVELAHAEGVIEAICHEVETRAAPEPVPAWTERKPIRPRVRRARWWKRALAGTVVGAIAIAWMARDGRNPDAQKDAAPVSSTTGMAPKKAQSPASGPRGARPAVASPSRQQPLADPATTSPRTVDDPMPLPPPVELARARQEQPPIDLSGFSHDERESAEAVCSAARKSGAAPYQQCLEARLAELASVPPVDLTGLSQGDLQALLALCSPDKFVRGPAAYRNCIARNMLTR